MKKILLLSLLMAGFAHGSLAQCSRKVMEAFGGTSSIALYNTYITIGAIADGYVSETYDSERVQSLMNEQVAMIDKVTEFLTSAIDDKSAKLSEEDRVYLVEMRLCLTYLMLEAQGLHDFAADGSEEANGAYNASRELAWESIEELLELNE